MPLPLLIPLALGVAGLFGAGKGVKAAIDNRKANSINEEAKNIADKANRDLERSKKASHATLELLGMKKLQAYEKNLSTFVKNFGKLKNVKLTESQGLKEIKAPNFSKEVLKEIENSCNLAIEALSGGGAAIGGGALVAFGAYNGTMLLASASTGTAISTLSGVAATNATLAWLGGGALSAGGLGVAGGTMVLGVMVAGPALLIFGSVLGAKAVKKLNNAKTNREHAKEYLEKTKLTITKLNQISFVAKLATDVISKLRTYSRRANERMAEAIAEYGSNWNDFPREVKEELAQAIKLAQLLKAIIDIPILDKDGNLEKTANSQINTINGALVQ